MKRASSYESANERVSSFLRANKRTSYFSSKKKTGHVFFVSQRGEDDSRFVHGKGGFAVQRKREFCTRAVFCRGWEWRAFWLACRYGTASQVGRGAPILAVVFGPLTWSHRRLTWGPRRDGEPPQGHGACYAVGIPQARVR